MSRWRWFLCHFIGASLVFAAKYFPMPAYLRVGTLAQIGTGKHGRNTGEWGLYDVGLFVTVAVSLFIT